MASLVADATFALNIAEVVKALANPARLRIVSLLCEGEENVGGIAAGLGLPQAIVSQQLRILRLHGLVESTREDGFAVYRLAEPRLRDLLHCLENCTSKGQGGN